jgi:protein-S-isoprenylcysteine O-methyltransferase Ste14
LLLRHLRAIALLPGTVTLLVPALILAGDGFEPVSAPLVGLGAVMIVAGFALWAWTVRLLARVGKGTLAPWDPTERLVAEGPYRVVRNPMISAVFAVLLGEAALFGSTGLLIWAGGFFLINHAFFLLYEEPALERRFGESYREYKRTVPRWIPRLP